MQFYSLLEVEYILEDPLKLIAKTKQVRFENHGSFELGTVFYNWLAIRVLE